MPVYYVDDIIYICDSCYQDLEPFAQPGLTTIHEVECGVCKKVETCTLYSRSKLEYRHKGKVAYERFKDEALQRKEVIQ